MIYPRFLARFLAWLGGYFWMPCPLCKKPFAGFELDPGWGAVIVKEGDVEHMYGVCSRSACAEEGQRQKMAYMQRMQPMNFKLVGTDPAMLQALATPLPKETTEL